MYNFILVIYVLVLSIPLNLNAKETTITGKGLYCVCKKSCVKRDVTLRHGGEFKRYQGIQFETDTSYKMVDLNVDIRKGKKYFRIRKWGVPKIHDYIITPKFINLGSDKINRENLEMYEYYMSSNRIKTTYQCKIETPTGIFNKFQKIKKKEETIEIQRLNTQYKKNKI